MGSTWRKAKLALGLNLCAYVPRTHEDPPPAGGDASSERFSDAALLSPVTNWDMGSYRPMTPTPSSHGLRLSRSGSKSSKQTCSICLTKIKQGAGQAIFTAECSHSFHFHCIASSVKHGNQICPVCRAKWKEIPSQAEQPPFESASNFVTTLRRLPPPPRRHVAPLFQSPEPGVYDDDESLDHNYNHNHNQSTVISSLNDSSSSSTIKITAFPEVSAAPRTKSYDQFTVLVNLKAKHDTVRQNNGTLSRTPVDLVTVLDISGSMAGTKLALLKRAMGFVIQNLSSSDRLSVISFSSTARRLFPLRKMTDSGKQQALQAVNSLVANGGTNIAEGLRKGAKVVSERKVKNPVSSIILLSDGQDTYTVNTGSVDRNSKPNYQLLLPVSIHEGSGFQTPVHTFGFGGDHDASSMHSISETSGGTFSFIETEAAIQDAFAQCIGGLLSVVVQELQVTIETTNRSVQIGSLRSGSYPSRVSNNGKTGNIDVGDLYADEERNFLVSINVPQERSGDETRLLKVKCVYKDPISEETVNLESNEVRLTRPESVGDEAVSIEVDRQRNRLQAALAMARARSAAEQGDLVGATSVIETFRKVLSESVSGKCRDPLCVALDAELKEMQDRLASRHVYEASGRAYILSGLSSHSWQRATARGDSTDGSSLVRAYQTPSMAQMLSRSQAMLLGSPSAQRLLEPLWPVRSQPKNR